MIDLSLYAKDTEELKLLNGEIIHLKKPTQNLILRMMNLEGLKKKDIVLAFDEIYSIAAAILSANTEGITFEVDAVKSEYDTTLVNAIIQSYMEWATKMVNQNF